MSLENEVVTEIISLFQCRVEEACAGETQLSPEERQAFVDRYLQAFREVDILVIDFLILLVYYYLLTWHRIVPLIMI